jgi:hypothetical protein
MADAAEIWACCQGRMTMARRPPGAAECDTRVRSDCTRHAGGGGHGNGQDAEQRSASTMRGPATPQPRQMRHSRASVKLTLQIDVSTVEQNTTPQEGFNAKIAHRFE